MAALSWAPDPARAEDGVTSDKIVLGQAAPLDGPASALGNGDLTFRLSDRFAAEYMKLRNDFNASVEKLQEAMLAISDSATTIRTWTQEISTAASDLSGAMRCARRLARRRAGHGRRLDCALPAPCLARSAPRPAEA